VTVDESAALKDQIRLEAKAARDAKKDLNGKRKAIGALVKSMVKSGSITQKQAASIINQANSINLDNEQIVQRFLDYTEKVFKDSNYREKLQQANKKRSSIRKSSKSTNQAEVVGMAKQFTNIEPSMVEDIDKYIEVAEEVYNAVKSSRQKGAGYIYKEAANIGEVNKYSTEQLEIQQKQKEENTKQRLLNKYSELVEDGTLKKEMSVKEILQTIESVKDPNEDLKNTEEVRKVVLEKLQDMVQELNDFVLKGKTNPITGEELELTEKEKGIFRSVVKMDLSELDVRSLVYLTEALDNYFVNGITSGLEANIRSYIGVINAKTFLTEISSGSKKIRVQFSGSDIVSLPLLIERIFRGERKAMNFLKLSGLSETINGQSKSKKTYENLITEYSKEGFYKTKDFMDQENMYERGMLSFLMRNVSGTQEQMQAETKRRIDAINESIENLSKSGDKDLERMGELYQSVANRLDIDSGDIDVIMSKASKANEDAVNWWISKWQEHYTELYDISLSVYNTQLSSDVNYTPDRIRVADINFQDIENDSSFVTSLGYVDTKKTGVLMENQRAMPTNGYVDLSFEMNNANSMKSALVDINTAASIRQLKAFMDSPSYRKAIPNMKTRALLTERISEYVKAIKGKPIITRDSLKQTERIFNTLSKYGSVKALGGLLSAPKQLTPIINTLINANLRTGLGDVIQSWDWITNLKMPISSRGNEARVNITEIDKKISKATGQVGKVGEFFDSAGELWLNAAIKYPDLFAARASFIAYYLQELKRLGVDTKNIDWKTHEVNQEAADYAQYKVDKQQNISDPLLMGRAWSSPDGLKKLVTKIFIPYTSFIYNTRAKTVNDLLTVTSPIRSKEDSIAARKSLLSLPIEIATFAGVGLLARYALRQITKGLFGDEDDKEETIYETKFGRLSRDDMYLYSPVVSNFALDLLSPLPGLTDDLTIKVLNNTILDTPMVSQETIDEMVREEDMDRIASGLDPMTDKQREKFIEEIKQKRTFKLYEPKPQDSYLGSLGTGLGAPGILFKEIDKLIDMTEAYDSGKVVYTDRFGREKTKYLKERDREKLYYAIILKGLFMTNLLPREASSISNQAFGKMKRNAIPEKQYELQQELRKSLKGRSASELELYLVEEGLSVKDIEKQKRVITEELRLDDDQIKEYIKLRSRLVSKDKKYLAAYYIKQGMNAEEAYNTMYELFKLPFSILN
jgi:Mg2+ and Co2+ transporter CorA